MTKAKPTKHPLRSPSDEAAWYQLLLADALGRPPRAVGCGVDVEVLLHALPRLQRIPPDLRQAFDQAMVELYEQGKGATR